MDDVEASPTGWGVWGTSAVPFQRSTERRISAEPFLISTARPKAATADGLSAVCHEMPVFDPAVVHVAVVDAPATGCT